MCIDWGRIRQSGISLVELIVFIVIVSVGVVGLVSVINPLVRFSADPMDTKQSLAIAESLLNEVLHQPFTWCDPEDATALMAQSYADCANPQNVSGATPSTETSRYGSGPGTFYDNVADYGGFSKANIDDASGGNAMTGYTADVAVARVGTALGLADDTAALSVTVTVRRNGHSFSMTGYRFRYAPRY
ncbi:type II secretion system protein [Ferribacterium limneticum]|uniref:type II secretion system protein n=1 Tax=Ferribacterium limneticum TaxID=76259 RepID=UPI001CFAF02B|nr:type II secretion system protein [Ferribacterium limneticum]UCV27513.1 type II secretion system protein [Ferribacterium limneticum]UCV31430.1 type II secretion system protein [Ferribacterium limneticum]